MIIRNNRITNIFVYLFRYIDYMIYFCVSIIMKKKRKKVGRKKDKGR